MGDLEGAGLDVLDCADEGGRGCPFCVSSCYGGLEGVGEHCLPAAGLALFADIGLAEDDFCGVLEPYLQSYSEFKAGMGWKWSCNVHLY